MVQSDGGILLLEDAEHIKDKCIVRDELVQIREGICHGFEAIIVLVTKRPLYEVVKLGVKVENLSLSWLPRN